MPHKSPKRVHVVYFPYDGSFVPSGAVAHRKKSHANAEARAENEWEDKDSPCRAEVATYIRDDGALQEALEAVDLLLAKTTRLQAELNRRARAGSPVTGSGDGL